MKVVEDVLEMLDSAKLLGCVTYVAENNPSANLPYHGLTHQLAVAGTANKIGVKYGLNFQQRLVLVLAGIFHDFGHTGSSSCQPDDRNIENALQGWEGYCDVMRDLHLYTETYNNQVVGLIKATRWPYEKEAKHVSEQIIRSADLVSSLEIHPLFALLALKEEMQIDMPSACRRQYSFYHTILEKIDGVTKEMYYDRIIRAQKMLGELDMLQPPFSPG